MGLCLMRGVCATLTLNRGTLESRRITMPMAHLSRFSHAGDTPGKGTIIASSCTKDGLTPPLLIAERLNYERIAEELDDAIAKSSGREREHLELARKKAEHLLVAGYRLATLEIGYALPVEPLPS